MKPKQKKQPQSCAQEQIQDSLGTSIASPLNTERQQQNPAMLMPPHTDHGLMPNLKWSFADSYMRLEEGGWSREATIRELPSSPTIAGVNMRLKAGAVRETHWHAAAEWAYMLYGNARITAIDEQGRTFQDDVSTGDIWYFPAGIPHAIQGLDDDGCEFILAFDDGRCSDHQTFSLTDWLAHTPKEVLAKNFGATQKSFATIPDHELYIFQSKVPGPLAKNNIAGNGPVPNKFSHRMLAQKPVVTDSGTIRITDSSIFPSAKTITAGLVEIKPGGMRELHWHPNADEWQFYIAGHARMTVFAANGNARTFNYQAGDIGVVPRPMGHYIENIGDTTLQFLALFKSDYFADISLAQWLAFTPYELVRNHLNIDASILASIPKQKRPIIP